MGFTTLLERLHDEDYAALAEQLTQAAPYIGVEERIQRLDRIYKRFHNRLHVAFQEHSDVIFEFIEFSDSAFIVVRDFVGARWLAKSILVSCLREWGNSSGGLRPTE